MIFVEQNRSPEEEKQPRQDASAEEDRAASPNPEPVEEQADSSQPEGKETQPAQESAASSQPEEPQKEKPPVFQVNFQEDAFEEFGELLPTQPVEPQSAEAVKPKRNWGWRLPSPWCCWRWWDLSAPS